MGGTTRTGTNIAEHFTRGERIINSFVDRGRRLIERGPTPRTPTMKKASLKTRRPCNSIENVSMSSTRCPCARASQERRENRNVTKENRNSLEREKEKEERQSPLVVHFFLDTFSRCTIKISIAKRRYHIPPARIERYAMENKQMESPSQSHRGVSRRLHRQLFVYS